jgi:hypothetical protein
MWNLYFRPRASIEWMRVGTECRNRLAQSAGGAHKIGSISMAESHRFIEQRRPNFVS